MVKKTTKGFSLIGVIVALFIVFMGVTTVLTLSTMSLEAASLSEMRLVASGLAQEGVEVVRGLRRAETDWSDWYNSVIDGDYLVQYDSTVLTPFYETPLKFDPVSGLYQYDSGSNSIFYRKITLDQISNDEVKVVVEIKWKLKDQWHYLTTEERLWNWK